MTPTFGPPRAPTPTPAMPAPAARPQAHRHILNVRDISTGSNHLFLSGDDTDLRSSSHAWGAAGGFEPRRPCRDYGVPARGRGRRSGAFWSAVARPSIGGTFRLHPF